MLDLPDRPSTFFGRNAIITDVYNQCTDIREGSLCRPVPVFHGPDGSGKTQLVKELVYRLSEIEQQHHPSSPSAREYSIVFWMQWENQAAQTLSICRLARLIGLRTDGLSFQDLLHLLILTLYPPPDAPPSAFFRWLLVFDGAADPASLSRFLAPSSVGDIIVITSSISEWAETPISERPFSPILVEKFARPESLEFLRAAISTHAAYAPLRTETKDWIKLSEEVADLPAALAFADKYIALTPGMTVLSYKLLVRARIGILVLFCVMYACVDTLA